MDKQQRRRWQVKDTVLSPWQDLPGRYTAAEISGMRRQGCFAAATPEDVGWRALAGALERQALDGRGDHLLRHPGREFHVLDLAAAGQDLVGEARLVDAMLLAVPR